MEFEKLKQLQAKPFYIVIETGNSPDSKGYLGYIVARTSDYDEAFKAYELNTKDRQIQLWKNGVGEWIR